MITKHALIGGASIPRHHLEANIPWEHKQKAYQEYLDTKSKEQPTSLFKTLAVGGGLGAGMGALMGAGLGPSATTVGGGALVGGGLGALMGAGIRSSDKDDIAHAQRAKKDPESHLVRLVAQYHQERMEEEEEERRLRVQQHAQLLAHVLASQRPAERKEVHHYYGSSAPSSSTRSHSPSHGDNDEQPKKKKEEPFLKDDWDRGSKDNDMISWKTRPSWARDDDAWERAVREVEELEGKKESSAPNYVRQYVVEKLASEKTAYMMMYTVPLETPAHRLSPTQIKAEQAYLQRAGSGAGLNMAVGALGLGTLGAVGGGMLGRDAFSAGQGVLGGVLGAAAGAGIGYAGANYHHSKRLRELEEAAQFHKDRAEKVASEKLALSPNTVIGAMGKRMADLQHMSPGLHQTALAARTHSQLNGVMHHVAGQETGAYNALRQGATQGVGARRLGDLGGAHGIAQQNTSQVFHAGNQALGGHVPLPVSAPHNLLRARPSVGNLSEYTNDMEHVFKMSPRRSPLLRPSAPDAAPSPLRIAG